VLNYEAVRAQHLAMAQSQMAAIYRHAYDPGRENGFSAYRYAVLWLANYAQRHPDWANELKQVVKRPVVDWIVERMGVSGVERVLLSVFVGVLLDVAFAAFINWELGRETPGQTMLAGSLSDTFVRWTREFSPNG
jgi:hypothetical protein